MIPFYVVDYQDQVDYHLKYAVEYLVEDPMYMIRSCNIPLEHPCRPGGVGVGWGGVVGYGRVG